MNKTDEVTIEGWVARDQNGCIFLYSCKPRKYSGVFDDYDEKFRSNVPAPGPFHTVSGLLPDDAFPCVKWEDDEPTEVEITIKIK